MYVATLKFSPCDRLHLIYHQSPMPLPAVILQLAAERLPPPRHLLLPPRLPTRSTSFAALLPSSTLLP